MQKLPIGIQDFKSLREENYLYIDKSERLFDLINAGKYIFLSRPRRFGKSLLCSTLGAFWEGRRELFKDTAIDSIPWCWDEYPVIRIDLNTGNYTTGKNELFDAIHDALLEAAKRYDVRINLELSPGILFKSLIRELANQTGQKVVVIIDEYDKPLLSTIDNDTVHDELKEILKGFYGALKSSDQYLEFVFLTGVTKFSQVSVFSDLNQLKDISHDPRFADIVGIADEEIDTAFAAEIESYSQSQNRTVTEYRADLKRWYNGYRFTRSEQTVYNSFGLLNHFDTGRFEPYWFATGTPTFLVKLIQEEDIDPRNLEGLEVSLDAFGNYRKDQMKAVPVLYQAGYLTISDFDPMYNLYTLDYPNDEVRIAFSEVLSSYYTQIGDMNRASTVVRFDKALRSGRIDDALETLKPFYAGIPYDLNDQTERHYQVVFYLIFRLLGLYCETEVKSAKGRADAMVIIGDYVYCFEMKFRGSAEEALRQIDEKGYLTPWTGSGKKLVKVGIEFDAEERNIGRWIVG